MSPRMTTLISGVVLLLLILVLLWRGRTGRGTVDEGTNRPGDMDIREP